MKLPKLSPEQIKDFDIMRNTNGFDILKRVFETSIEIQNAELINYDFKFDENGEVNRKSTMKFRDMQLEADILKRLFVFIKKPVIITNVTDNEVYEGYKKQ